MLQINDPQKHKVMHTWELYDFIINYWCVQDLVLLHANHSFLFNNFAIT